MPSRCRRDARLISVSTGCGLPGGRARLGHRRPQPGGSAWRSAGVSAGLAGCLGSRRSARGAAGPRSSRSARTGGGIPPVLRERLGVHPDLVQAAACDLAGRDYACWCPPDRPYHGDELAKASGPRAAQPCSRLSSAARPRAPMGLLLRDRLRGDPVAPLWAFGSIPDRRRHRQDGHTGSARWRSRSRLCGHHTK